MREGSSHHRLQQLREQEERGQWDSDGDNDEDSSLCPEGLGDGMESRECRLSRTQDASSLQKSLEIWEQRGSL